MGCLAFINVVHYWPVIKRFLTWSTSAHLFPLCIIVPWWSVKTLGLHQHDLVHFDSSSSFLPVTSSTLICCSFSTTTFYMLAPELHDCTMCSTPYDLVSGDSVTCVIRYLFTTSLINLLYVILGHWFRLVLPGGDHMIHYVLYSLAILVYVSNPLCTSYADMIFFHWAWVYPPQTWAIFLISITSFLAG